MADIRAEIIAQARAYPPLPYRLTPPPDGMTSVDCSMFVLQVCAAAGAPFKPGIRTAEQERQACVPIGWDDVMTGDLLFFEHTYEPSEAPGPDGSVASHVGISLGTGSHAMWDAHQRGSSPVAAGLTNIGGDYWQSHLLSAGRLPALAHLVEKMPESMPGAAWQFFPADAITRATGANLEHVLAYWPKLAEQLGLAGVYDRWTAIAAIATIIVEVGVRFEPIHEYGTPANWAGYSGGAAYAGRGFIQLTHDYNYRAYSRAVNDLWGAGGAIDLVAHPDDALDPDVAAAVLALYFRDHNIPAMAVAENWAGVRKAVNGGLTGWQVFADAVEALKKIPAPATPPADDRDARLEALFEQIRALYRPR